MRTVFFVSCVIASSAFGAIYETAVDIDDEEDIFAMYQRGDISLDTADTLLELLREGVDLNTAPREKLYDLPGLTYSDVDKLLLYRKEKGRIEDPAELVASGVLTEEQLIGIAVYIRLDPATTRLPVSGRFRLLSQYTVSDPIAPPALLSARLKGPFDLTAGAMLTGSRMDPARPVYDPALQALTSQGYQYRVDAPRFFLQWQNANRRVLVGTFNIGFAERLTLDNTRRTTPRGIYVNDDFRRSQDLSTWCRTTVESGATPPPECLESNRYVTADYQTRDVFRGVAGSIENLDLGDQRSLSLYGFLSYQSRSVYQYDLYDRAACADPKDSSSACSAPPILIVDPQQGLPVGRARYSTLPGFFDELASGGHVDFKPSFPLRFGLTGYGAVPFFNTAPPGSAVQPDFQDTSRYPNGGPFGAIGADAQAVLGAVNLHLEVARSFDRAVNSKGGGFAALQRTTWSPKGHELELVLRYYDNQFLNPYARPFSGPDEDAGQRARNEAGARLRYFGKFTRDWQFRATADFWALPFSSSSAAAGTPNLIVLARADFTGWKFLKPSLWFRMSDRNLTRSDRGCTEIDSASVRLEPIDSSGDFDGDVTYLACDSHRIAQRVDVRALNNKLTISEQVSLTWRDDISQAYSQAFRVDLQAWLEVRAKPLDWFEVRARSRLRNEGIDNPASYEDSLWTFIEAAFSPVKGTRLAARYDLFLWLDQRASTLARNPSPEHRFLVDLRTGF